MQDLAAGTVIADDFEVVRPLKRGGMGAVYVARQRSTDTERALKVLLPELVIDAGSLARFEQEARIGSRIESDHVVHVVGAGVDKDLRLPWLAMELLRGEDLDDHATRVGPLSREMVGTIFRQLAHPLSRAHARGIVHRDLKPHNLFLAEARAFRSPTQGVPFTVKILDYGIATLAGAGASAERTSIGTPAWMAPEQTDNRGSIGPQADVWALGLIAFRLLTGHSFWLAALETAPSAMRFLTEVLFDPLPSASDRAEKIPGAAPLPSGFDAWFEACVHRDPSRRFTQGGDAAEALADLLDQRDATIDERVVVALQSAVAHPPPTVMLGGGERSEHELVETRHEQKSHLRHFYGREDLLGRVSSWIHAEGTKSYAVITGGPGSGKSALAAVIANVHDAPLHFMKTHRNPIRFLSSLASQTARRAGVRLALDPRAADLDDLRDLLVRSVDQLARAKGRAVVVIDALDELDETRSLTALPANLPEGARFILTTRPDRAVLAALRARIGGWEEIEATPLNPHEVEAILASRTGPEEASGPRLSAAELCEKTGGLPLLVRRAADNLDAGSIDALPTTIAELFDEVYGAIAATPPRGRILELLSLAREPLDADQLRELLELDGLQLTPRTCRDALAAMSEYLLEARPGGYLPWHRGLAEHVQKEVLGPTGVQSTEALFAGWAAGASKQTSSESYALRHRIAHLLASGSRDEARALLSNHDFIRDRLARGSVFDLLMDLESIGAPEAAAVKRHAHFLARHPYALSSILDGFASDEERSGRRAWIRQLRPLAADQRSTQVYATQGHSAEILGLAASADGQCVASASADGTVCLWDAQTGRDLRRLTLSKRRVLAVSFSPDGQTLACGTDEGLVLYQGSGGFAEGRVIPVALPNHQAMWAVAHSPDGQIAAVGDRSRKVSVLTANGSPLSQVDVGGIVACVAFSGDGQRIAASTTHGDVVLMNRSAEVLLRLPQAADATPWGLAFVEAPHKDGCSGLAVASSDGTLRIWSMDGNLISECSAPDDRLYAVAISPDGARVAFGGSQGKVYVSTLPPQARLLGQIRGNVNSLAFVPGTDLIVAAGTDKSVVALKSTGAEIEAQLRIPVTAACISPDKQFLAGGRFDGELRIWKLQSDPPGKLSTMQMVHGSRITAITFAANSSLIATGSQDGTAKVFRVDQLTNGARRGDIRPIATLTGHSAAVTAVAMVPPAGKVLTGSSDYSVRLWSVFGGRELARFEHEDTVVSVAADAAGRTVAGLARNGCLRLWDLESAQEIATIMSVAPEAAARSVHFAAVTEGDRTKEELLVLIERRDRSWSGYEIAKGIARELLYFELAPLLPRWVLRQDESRSEMVLFDPRKLELVGAYPQTLDPYCASSDGRLVTGWSGGDLYVLAVEEAPQTETSPDSKL